ncbi:hypothetical protein GQ53DRAFT_151483 [Thozetella sp. PMI_491]|nr:hypothetical protein GQ53DRAFT_151483 [Thozetella sp. PMI_491]
MHSINSIALLLAGALTARAIPSPQIAIPPTNALACPVIESQHQATGQAWQSAGTAHGGEPFTLTEGYSVGTTWQVGADLGINVKDIISLGISSSVSETITQSVNIGVGKTCPPGPWRCGLIVHPGVWQVDGHVEYHVQPSCSEPKQAGKDDEPYSVQIPRVDKAGNPFFDAEVCACKNAEHWADNGAPSIVCLEDCTLS